MTTSGISGFMMRSLLAGVSAGFQLLSFYPTRLTLSRPLGMCLGILYWLLVSLGVAAK
jgi:hypothetical protein